MVNLVREGVEGSRCLSIGDGANDVAMIQQAHIGVGISGQEGLQAVNASDYAIAQFRYLKRLLLVHGRWNYRRLAKLVCYMFYKNIVLVLAQWFFTFCNANSGQKYYLEFGTQLYNLCLTAIPVLVLGVLDQDLPAAVVEQQPEVYKPGLTNTHFSDRIFWGWMGATVVDAIIIFGSAASVYAAGGAQGSDLGMWQLGALVFTMVVVVANARLMWHVYIFQAVQPFFFLASIALWFGVAAFVSANIGLGQALFQSWDWFHVWGELVARPGFWCALLFAVVTSNGTYFWAKGYKRAFGTRLYHVLQEIVKEHGAGAAAYIEEQRHASARATSSVGGTLLGAQGSVANPVRMASGDGKEGSSAKKPTPTRNAASRIMRSTSLCYDQGPFVHPPAAAWTRLRARARAPSLLLPRRPSAYPP